MSRRLLATLLLLPTLGLASCGVPADGQPHIVAAPAPYREPTTTTSAATTGTPRLIETLYLVRDDAIVAVTRPVDKQPDPAALLAELTTGPSEPEKASGLSSVLAGSTVIEGVAVDNGLATVALGEGLDGASKQNVLAMAQIVCTLDALPDVNAVVFTRAGVRASVPRGDASQTKDPVTAADYAQVIEPR